VDAKLRASIEIDVGAEVPHRELTAATDAGIAAANATLGALVEAVGSLGSAREGVRRVRIELAMRATPASALATERAFADAFVLALARRGYAAVRA
jgi:hypothetical protein